MSETCCWDTQAEIGEKLGWSRDKVARYNQILENVVTGVRETARKHQEGRVTGDVTNVTFTFTEGWFRNSGIYELTERCQREKTPGQIVNE